MEGASQFSDGGAGLPEAEAVEAEEAEQDGVEERGQEVVVRVPAARTLLSMQ